MLVDLKRPFSCKLGVFKPESGGVILPDSLADILPSDAEILEGPDNSEPVPDPEMAERKDSFVSVTKGKGKKVQDAKVLSDLEVETPKKPDARKTKKTLLSED